jgi:ArsR family transcriptional regulator
MELPETVRQAVEEKGGMENLLLLIPDEEALCRDAALHRALADPTRLKILSLLTSGTLCVCVIKEILGLADSKLSYHFTILKKAGLISSEQQGNWVLYSLTETGADAIHAADPKISAENACRCRK